MAAPPAPCSSGELHPRVRHPGAHLTRAAVVAREDRPYAGVLLDLDGGLLHEALVAVATLRQRRDQSQETLVKRIPIPLVPWPSREKP